MKKLVALILAVMMLMSLTAAFAEKTPTIAYVPKVIGQPWWDHVQQGVEQWAADKGIDVIYKGGTTTDSAEQVQIMTDLVNQGIDILCFSPNDPDACEEICKTAREKGIIVGNIRMGFGHYRISIAMASAASSGLGNFSRCSSRLVISCT